MRAALTFGFVVSLMVSPALADATGTWQSEPSDAGRFVHVEISPCGAQLCGVVVDTNSPTPEKVMGKTLIRDMAADGAGEWSGGTIWAPDDDETYDAKMKLLDADRLEVSGCIAFGMICRGQVWTRVK